jgi:transcriptional regulator with XRE-family HTH domain
MGMQIKRWIKEAEKAGWRVSGVHGPELRLSCSCYGCTGSLSVSIANAGPVPEPCQRPHVKNYSRDTFAHYQSLVEELRRRRRALGLDQIDANAALGLSDGHLSKLESFARIASPPMLLLWAQGLGLSITTTPAPLPPATVKAIQDRAGRPYQEQQARFKHSTDDQAQLRLEGPQQ